jgi:protein-disulfide isomerase
LNATATSAGAAFARPELQDEIKWHCKYARQNGIHVSPTFMVNGLVQPDLGSGDDVSVGARIMAWSDFPRRRGSASYTTSTPH